MNSEIIVTIEDGFEDKIEEIAGRLTAAGMTVTSVLASMGVITGSAPGHLAPGFSSLEGVGDVEISRDIHLAPPGSDIQ